MSVLLYELAGADASRPFSPHCWKVAMALAHKHLPFSTRQTSFTGVPNVEDGFSKTVPVIRDGDTLLSDSFEIALYLERTYPDRPSLFGGSGGEAAARFVERWTQLVVQAQMIHFIVLDIHDRLEPNDQDYFRKSREARFGKSLEQVIEGREQRLPAFRASLEPLRNMLAYQPFIGGESPLFADYIAFGAFQWARIVSPFRLLAQGDPLHRWIDRLLETYDALAGRVPAAA